MDSELHNWIQINLFDQFEFGRGSVLGAGGFGWMNEDGSLDRTQPQFAWLTARLVHVFALGVTLGVPGAFEIAARGFAAIAGPLHDDKYGGWFSSVNLTDEPVDSAKACYAQAHVAIAAASAAQIEIPGAQRVLKESLAVLHNHFWDEQTGMFGERFARDWSTPSDHRTATANMHCVEALLAGSAALGDSALGGVLLQRALRVGERLAHRDAASNNWRMPQYYTPDWHPDLERNDAKPADPFAPYGETIGLGFEWARLIIELSDRLGSSAPDWMLDSACRLHDRAASDGWRPDGNPGFVYTTDWEGATIIDRRLHWVHAEAVSSAATLGRATGNHKYSSQLQAWWTEIKALLIDPANGSWRHEVDAHGQSSSVIWRGRPDLYHSVHAAVISLGNDGTSPTTLARSMVRPG